MIMHYGVKMNMQLKQDYIDTLTYPSISHWEVVSLTDVKLCSITLRNTIHLTGRSFASTAHIMSRYYVF